MNDSVSAHNSSTAGPRDGSAPVAEFPSEPFACPACGQMLAPSCRVCVACRQPINPAEIKRPESPTAYPYEAYGSASPTLPVRFSWLVFFIVLVFWLLLAVVAQRFLGTVRSQWVMGSLVLLSSAWVFYDAHAKLIPKPLRWALGALLLWIVFFPWYLARRQNPAAPCRFMEVEVSPITRALLTALVIFFLVGLVLMMLKGLGMAAMMRPGDWQQWP